MPKNTKTNHFSFTAHHLIFKDIDHRPGEGNLVAFNHTEPAERVISQDSAPNDQFESEIRIQEVYYDRLREYARIFSSDGQKNTLLDNLENSELEKWICNNVFNADVNRAQAFLILQKREALKEIRLADRSRGEVHAMLQSETDPLTKLFNRQGLESRMGQIFSQAEREGEAVSLLVFDLDRFKTVNDELGHAVGDIALRVFSNLLKENIRSMDIVGRQGGEEFVVVLPKAGEEEALKIAERIKREVELKLKNAIIDQLSTKQIEELGKDKIRTAIKGTSSIGVSTFQPNGDGNPINLGKVWSSLFEKADQALSVAKTVRGRNAAVAASQVTANDIQEQKRISAAESAARKGEVGLKPGESTSGPTAGAESMRRLSRLVDIARKRMGSLVGRSNKAA